MSGSVRTPTSATVVEEDVVGLPDGFASGHRHGVVPRRVAYRLVGAPGAPVVAVLGGISANRRVCAASDGEAPGWWDAVVGPGSAIDLRHHRVLSLDYIGGPGDSGAPTPPPGWQGIPAVTPGDQADALALVAERLVVTPLRAVIGASYGGAVALAFAASHAEKAERVLVVGAAHESHPLATAVRIVQRRIVETATQEGRESEGLALARALAMTTYRSDREFQSRFGTPPSVGPSAVRFGVEDYLDAHGERFAAAFTADQFLCLSQSLDLHHLDPADIRAPVTLVSIDPDMLAPRWQMEALHRALGPGHVLVEVDSPRGHDAFLTDGHVFTPILRDFLRQDERAPAR